MNVNTAANFHKNGKHSYLWAKKKFWKNVAIILWNKSLWQVIVYLYTISAISQMIPEWWLQKCRSFTIEVNIKNGAINRDWFFCIPEVAYLIVFKKFTDFIYWLLYYKCDPFLKTAYLKNTIEQIEINIVSILIYKQYFITF